MELTRYVLSVCGLLTMMGLSSFPSAHAEEAADMQTSHSIIIQAINSDTAEEAVELSTSEVLALIERSRDYAKSDPERFYAEAEALLRPVVDFTRFARNVMGPYYKKATPEQRDRFAESFKWSLVRTYALALTEFHSGEVKVIPPRRKPRNADRVNVSMEIKLQGNTYLAVYVMRRKEQIWQMQNLIIEGVNVGLNYKTQFSAAMKKPEYGKDLDTVISAWTDFIGDNSDSEDNVNSNKGAGR